MRILTQPSTPYHVHSESAEAVESPLQNSAGYACPFCSFTSSRVNVMMMHIKSCGQDPTKSSLPNFARSRSVSEIRVKTEVKGSRLFADARAGLVKKRKLVYNSSKSSSEPTKKKSKVMKKPKKKEETLVELKEEKTNSIFGDWSEDEHEEEEVGEEEEEEE